MGSRRFSQKKPQTFANFLYMVMGLMCAGVFNYSKDVKKTIVNSIYICVNLRLFPRKSARKICKKNLQENLRIEDQEKSR